jgi:hypothetical protein
MLGSATATKPVPQPKKAAHAPLMFPDFNDEFR